MRKKRIDVPLSTKKEAIKRLELGESIYTIAKELGVDRTTICKWGRNRDAILSTQCYSPKTKRVKTGLMFEINDKVAKWVVDMSEKKTPVSSFMI